MTVAEILQLVAISVQTIMLVIIFLQIRVDHERRVKQATIDVINKDFAEARQQLESRYGHDFITDDEVHKIAEDKEKYATITRLMGVLEYICTGINIGIYDGKLVYRLTGTSFIRSYNRLEKLIELRRQKESPAICIELQYVVSSFQTMRANIARPRDSVIKSIFTKTPK
jgi:hypothetical protein